MTAERPEYIRCIEKCAVKPSDSDDERLRFPMWSWCGEKLYSYDMAFINLNHALLNNSIRLPCKKCLLEAKKVIKAILSETE